MESLGKMPVYIIYFHIHFIPNNLEETPEDRELNMFRQYV
jgi:hypothetical protein